MSLFDINPSSNQTKHEPVSQIETIGYLRPGESLILSEPKIISCNSEKNNSSNSRFNFLNFGHRGKVTQSTEQPKVAPQQHIIQLQNEFLLILTENTIRMYRYGSCENENLQKEKFAYFKDEQVTWGLQKQLQIKKQYREKSKLQPISEITLDLHEVKSVKIFNWTWARQKCLKSHFKDKPRILHVAVEDSESKKLEIVCFDSVTKKLSKVGKIFPPAFILCWNFVYPHEIILWSNNMQLYHYFLSETDGCKLIRSVPSHINPKKELEEQKKVEKLKKGRIRDPLYKSVPKRQNSVQKSKSVKKGQKSFIEKYLPQKLPPVVEEKTQTIIIKYEMNFCTLLGYRDPDQQKILPLFFTLYNEEYNILKIKCMEIIYPINMPQPSSKYLTKIVEPILSLKQRPLSYKYPEISSVSKVHEIVSHNIACPELIDDVNVQELGNSYYLKLKSEFIFIEKRYDHYYPLDSLQKLNPKSNLLVAENSNLVASHNEDSSLIELNEISGISINQSHMNEQDKIGLNLKLIDFVDLRFELLLQKRRSQQFNNLIIAEIRKNLGWYLPTKSLEQTRQQFEFFKDLKDNTSQKQQQNTQEKKSLFIKVRKFWINKMINHFDFYFILEVISLEMKENNQLPILCLYKGHKFSKEEKILELSQESKSQQEIIKIKEIGALLGVTQTQFYMNLWKASPKTYDDIKKYLLKCKNFNKIIDQIRLFLKKRPMFITQLVNILIYLLDMIKQKMKTDMTEEDLRQYFNTEFVLRKFKTFDSRYEIDDVEFGKAFEGNLLQIIDKLIDEKLKKYYYTEKKLKQHQLLVNRIIVEKILGGHLKRQKISDRKIQPEKIDRFIIEKIRDDEEESEQYESEYEYIEETDNLVPFKDIIRQIIAERVQKKQMKNEEVIQQKQIDRLIIERLKNVSFLKTQRVEALLQTFVEEKIMDEKICNEKILERFEDVLKIFVAQNQSFKELGITQAFKYRTERGPNQKIEHSSMWQKERKPPPKLTLVIILHQFRFPLLDDYLYFLNYIFRSHEEEILVVLKLFPELLPKYPFFTQNSYELLKNSEKIFRPNTNSRQIVEDLVDFKTHSLTYYQQQEREIEQQGAFSRILPKHFAEEPAFIHNLVLLLDQQYSRSYIIKMINDLFNDEVQDSKGEYPMIKFFNHMLIQKDVGQFIENLKMISDDYLHLFMMEYFIKVALKQKKKAHIKKMIELFTQNYIPGDTHQELLNKIELGAGLYEIIMTHNILDQNNQNKISLFDIVKTPIQKWIALFFLGNKEQKELLCTDFKQLFKTHKAYTDAIGLFVKSEHCSIIELSIMSEQISKLSQQQQLESEDLISVIIDGFCSKIHLYEVNQCNNFLSHISHLHFTPELLFKIDRIQKFKVCLRIFEVFRMQEKTLYELVHHTDEIIYDMMEAFFQGELLRQQVPVNRTFYNIEECQGMWKLLCYLRDHIFFEKTTESLLMTYGKKMIEWQRFQEVKNLAHRCDEFRMQNEEPLNSRKIVKNLMKESIQNLYSTENLLFDANVKKYIRNILDIDLQPEENQIVIKERAKLQLVQIFEAWDYKVPLTDLKMMCESWSSGEEGSKEEEEEGHYYRPIMIEIILKYGQHLNEGSLQRLFCLLMQASEGKKFNEAKKTDEFYHYCSKLAEALMGLDRLEEASKIIVILNEKYEMNYLLMVECMLKSLIENFRSQFKAEAEKVQMQVEELEHAQEQDNSLGSDVLSDNEESNILHSKKNKIQFFRAQNMIQANQEVMDSKKTKQVNSQYLTNKKKKVKEVEKWKLLPTKELILTPPIIHFNYSYQFNPLNQLWEWPDADVSIHGDSKIQKKKKEEEKDMKTEEEKAVLRKIQEQKIEKCWDIKHQIENFVDFWIGNKEDELNRMFQNCFMERMERGKKKVFIDRMITFNRNIEINTNTIWNIVVFGLTEKFKNVHQSLRRGEAKPIQLAQYINIQQLAYCYFLMQMGLRCPNLGFKMLEYINYPHEASVKTLAMLKKWCDQEANNIYFINYSVIFNIYLEYLTKILVIKFEGEGISELQENRYMREVNTNGDQYTDENQINKEAIYENLKLFRKNLREGHYQTQKFKNQPLIKIILKMDDMNIKAKKQVPYRLKRFRQSKQGKHTFQIEQKIKQTPRIENNVEGFLKNEASPLLGRQDHSMAEVNSNDEEEKVGMTLENFRRVKDKVFRDKSAKKREQSRQFGQKSFYREEQLAERSVVQQIIRNLKKPTSIQPSLNIPLYHIDDLKETVEKSIREIKEEKSMFNRTAFEKDLSIDFSNIQNRTMSALDNRKNRDKKNKIDLVAIINSQEYEKIRLWSGDAVFIETARHFKDANIDFIKVVYMFYEQMAGNHNKIGILSTCLPDPQTEKIYIKNQHFKQVFPLQYLSRDFPVEYGKHYDQILINIDPIIHQLNPEQIKQLGSIINELCQIQYRKNENRSWEYILAEKALQKLGKNGTYEEKVISRLYDLVKIFSEPPAKRIESFNSPNRRGKEKLTGIQYFRENFSSIFHYFPTKGESERLKQALENATKMFLHLDIKDLKCEMKMKEKRNPSINMKSDSRHVNGEQEEFKETYSICEGESLIQQNEMSF